MIIQQYPHWQYFTLDSHQMPFDLIPARTSSKVSVFDRSGGDNPLNLRSLVSL